LLNIPPYPSAIIFDWDNTLVDSWGVITYALNKARSAYGLEVWSEEEARIKSAKPLSYSFPKWFGDDWEDARDIFYDSYKERNTDFIKAMNGAESLLNFIYEKNLPSMIVTAKNTMLLSEELNNFGWGKFFKSVVCSGDAENNKPNPDVVNMALNKAKIEYNRQNIWFIGDSHVDVECALRSGCMPVIVNNPNLSVKLGVKWCFSDCNEIKNALYTYSSSK